MTLIRYIDKKVAVGRREIINVANEMVRRYQARGVTMTLRAIYYQFVARYPEILDPKSLDLGETVNTIQNYKRLGVILNEARLTGMMSWEAMDDITRNVIEHPNWTGPHDFLEDAPGWFASDMWENQPFKPFMWIEKDAQIGTFQNLCAKHRVPLFSCRGNVSQSEMWKAGRQFRDLIYNGQTPVVLYAGDHDPNGLDMTRDVTKRLAMFAEEEIEVRRVLLNMDQIQEFNPPPNPVKNTDSRAKGYRRAMAAAGHDPDECFEMDAMRPEKMIEIVEEEIESLRDDRLWEKAAGREGNMQAAVAGAIERGRVDTPDDDTFGF